MNKIKETTKIVIANEALTLFLNESIVSVTIADIAKKIEIGEATIYRYFGKKINLVMASASILIENIYKSFSFDNCFNGYEKIKKMYSFYLEIFKSHCEYYRFLYELDNLILIENVDKEKYQTDISLYKKLFDKAYEEGLKDNSIIPIEDKDSFYYTTTHSLLNLCEKLSANSILLQQDETIDKSIEIETLINIFLYKIEKKGN